MPAPAGAALSLSLCGRSLMWHRDKPRVRVMSRASVRAVCLCAWLVLQPCARGAAQPRIRDLPEGAWGGLWSRLVPLHEGQEDLVVSNVTTLAVRDADGRSTGWLLQMEASFTRDPPVYSAHDESIDVSAVVMLYKGKGAGADRKPPLRVGTVLKGALSLQGRVMTRFEFFPLVKAGDGSVDELAAHYHMMVYYACMHGWMDGWMYRCIDV